MRRVTASRVWCGVGIWLSALAFSAPASAYQQTMTCYPSGPYACRAGEIALPVSWRDRSQTYYVNAAGSPDLARDADGQVGASVLDSLAASFAAWTDPSCARIEVEYAGLTERTDIGFDRDRDDNINLVIWQDEWPYASSSAYALTSVTFSVQSGVISDADVEFNDEYFEFTNDPEGRNIVDLRNTMTHEAGHFIGLDHSSVEDSPMYKTAPEGETKKITLEQDDLSALCAIYDSEPEPLPDTTTGDSGTCAIAPQARPSHPTLPWLVIALTGVAAALCGRRRW